MKPILTKKMVVTKANLLKYAAMYDASYPGEDKETEDRMKCLLRRQRYLRRENLISIGRWKSPRPVRHYEKNSDSKAEQATRLSLSSRDERVRVESLLGSKGGLRGVGYPVASTILHFAFPDTYPIMDFRVMESLYGESRSSYTFEVWQEYCARIHRIARRHKPTIRTVDKALWMYSKARSGRHPCAEP